MRESGGLARHTFGAMGTEIEVLIEPGGEGPALFEAAEVEFERLESLFSRFRPESELSRLNESGRQPVSPELFELLKVSLAGREATGGRFDPTVHDAIVAAGYDRTFDDIEGVSSPLPTRPCGGEMILDSCRRVVELAPQVRLDLGGIAKGYSADRVCALLSEHGSCLVNAGGDLAVHGLLGDQPWPVAVALPNGSFTVTLASGALATSGTDSRTWLQAGRLRHHLIDPRTGEPSETDLLRVTAAGSTAAEAEIWAKALLLAGEREAAAEAAARGIPCVLVTRDGRTRLEGGLG
jgi:thiamine biosynthesis lipoprotein